MLNLSIHKSFQVWASIESYNHFKEDFHIIDILNYEYYK